VVAHTRFQAQALHLTETADQVAHQAQLLVRGDHGGGVAELGRRHAAAFQAGLQRQAVVDAELRLKLHAGDAALEVPVVHPFSCRKGRSAPVLYYQYFVPARHNRRRPGPLSWPHSTAGGENR